jgi:hypothetical protein
VRPYNAPVNKAEAERYKERWQNIKEVNLKEQREASPETKLHQSTELLRLARGLGWDLRLREADIQAVRVNWNRLRARLR